MPAILAGEITSAIINGPTAGAADSLADQAGAAVRADHDFLNTPVELASVTSMPTTFSTAGQTSETPS